MSKFSSFVSRLIILNSAFMGLVAIACGYVLHGWFLIALTILFVLAVFKIEKEVGE